MLQMFTY